MNHNGSKLNPANDVGPLSPQNNQAESSSERRHASRLGVDFLLNRFVNGYPFISVARDLSKTGMRLKSIRHVDTSRLPARASESKRGVPNRYMGLQFQLPGSEDIVTCSGEVVFEDENTGEIGIRFTTVSPPSVAAMDCYFERVQQAA